MQSFVNGVKAERKNWEIPHSCGCRAINNRSVCIKIAFNFIMYGARLEIESEDVYVLD